MTTDPKTLRGTIIVDTSMLYSLYAAAHGEFRADATIGSGVRLRRYLDVLGFLSRNGYDILIPEMVSFEAENVIASGKDADRWFTRADSKRNKVLRAEMKHFLQDVARGRHPNIHIVPDTGPVEVDTYLKSVSRVLNRANPKHAAMIARLVELQREDTTGFGERAILSMLEQHDRRIRSSNIFVLSDDRHVMDDLSKRHPGVHVCNTLGLLDALKQSRLWEGLGLDSGVTPVAVMRDIEKQMRHTYGEHSQSMHVRIIDCSGADLEYCLPHLGGFKREVAHPMQQSLGRLFTDLGWGEQFERLEAVAPEDGPSQLDKFYMKYGDDWRQRREGQKQQGNNRPRRG